MKLSEIKRNLKHCLKEKVKINHKTILTFLMMGFISFSNVKLHIGSSLTDTSTAIGRGSISTGKNTQALGTNSFASGNNMSREQYEELLRANNEKLREIESKSNLLNDDLEVLENLKNENRDLNTKLEFMRNVENRINEVETEKNSRSPELIREIEEKKGYVISYKREIDDLENRIDIVNNMNLDNLNINDENSLNDYAIKLKRQMEKGKTFISEYGENGIDLEEYIQFFKKIPANYKDINPTKDKFTSINDENEFLFMPSNDSNSYNTSEKHYEDYKKWIEKKDNGDLYFKLEFHNDKLFKHINDVFNTSLSDKTNLGLEKPIYGYNVYGDKYPGDFDRLNKISLDDYLYGRSDTYEIKFRPITGLKKETVREGSRYVDYYYYTQEENYETPEEFYTDSGITIDNINELNTLNKEKYDIKYKHFNENKLNRHREILNTFITLKKEYSDLEKKENKNDNDYLKMEIINNKIKKYLEKSGENEDFELNYKYDGFKNVNGSIIKNLLNITPLNLNDSFSYSDDWNNYKKITKIDYFNKYGNIEYDKNEDNSINFYKIKANEYYKDLLKYYENKINEHNYSEFENKIRELDEIKDLKNTNSTLIEKFRKEIDRLKALERTVSDEIIVKESELNGFEIELANLRNSIERVNPESVEELRNNIEEKERIVNAKREEIETLKNSLVELSDGENAIATGSETVATGKNSIGLGTHNLVFAENGTALGNNISLVGKNLVAIGEGHSIIGQGSGTLGDPNVIYGNNNYVIGNDNKVGTENAPKNNVFILGSNVDASNVENAVVLGNNSTAVSNGISIGNANETRKIHFVKEAEISATSKEAVNGSQLFALADGSLGDININNWKNKLGITGNGNIIANPNAVSYDDDTKSSITLGNENKPTRIRNVAIPIKDLDATNKIYVDYNLNKIENKIKVIHNDINSATSHAIAMANIPQTPAGKLFGIGVAYGNYKGEQALALGLTATTKNKNLAFKSSVSFNTKKEYALGLGINYSFGNAYDVPTENKGLDKNVEKALKDLTNENKALKDKLHKINDGLISVLNDVKKMKYKFEDYILDGFEFNKYDLTKEQKEQLDLMIPKFVGENITIIGFADVKGDDKYNLNLGLNRANMVKKYLENKGIKNIRVASMGYNKITDGSDANNRRVEIIIK